MPRQYFAIESQLVARGEFSFTVNPSSPRFVEGDEYVSFVRKENDAAFLGRGKIDSATEEIERLAEGGNLTRTRIVTLTSVIPFDYPRRLAVLAGSLEKVFRFLDPLRHFRRKYVKLTSEDFKTIVADRVHVRRSVFRYLFSALPLEIQASFVQQHGGQLELDDRNLITNYEPASRLLVRFLSQELDEATAMLSQLSVIHRDLSTSVAIPPLRDLVLEADSRESITFRSSVALGQTSAAAQRLRSTNRLFSAGANETALFAECEDQLNRPGPNEESKRWNDPIFW